MLFRFRPIRLCRVLIVLFCFVLACVSNVNQVLAIDREFFAGNDILFYDPSCAAAPDVATTSLVEGDNIKKAFFYFVTKGLTAAQAAGVVGNLMQESGVNPRSVQAGGPGRGVAQWSAGDRWEKLKSWAKGKDIYSLQTQLDFMWHEMTEVSPWKLSLKGSTSSEYPSLKAITADTMQAAIKAGHSFGFLYERFGKSGSRDTYAGQVWTIYHSEAKSASPGIDNPDASCASGFAVGTCDNAPSGWVQVTNKVVQVACAEWNKKVTEDAGDNCDHAGNITKYARATGFGRCGLSWCGMFVGYVSMPVK
jgi:hypothetical protein